MIVYLITNKNNGKVYVGQTRDTAIQRMREHFGARHKSNLRFHRAIKKHGIEAFSVKVLWEGNQEEVNEREKFFISQYHSCDYSFGYNMSPGGFGISEERRKQISIQMSGSSNPMFGKPSTRGNLGNKLTPEQRNRISVGRKNKGKGPNAKHSMPGESNPFFGRNHSKESINKMSVTIKTGIAALTVEQRAKRFKHNSHPGESNPFFGRKHSEETRAKMRASWAQRRAAKEVKTPSDGIS